MEKEATKVALNVLKEKGAAGLTVGESLILKLGIACGIQAAVNKFVGRDEKQASHSSFAE